MTGLHALCRTSSQAGEHSEERARIVREGPQVGLRLAPSPVGAERRGREQKAGGYLI